MHTDTNETEKGLIAAKQTETQMHCALSQADNTSSRTRARNCFPVVALGKLKLHYGPLEESGERVMEEEEERGSKRKGERKSETRASVLFFSALATTKQEKSDTACNLSSVSVLCIPTGGREDAYIVGHCFIFQSVICFVPFSSHFGH